MVVVRESSDWDWRARSVPSGISELTERAHAKLAISLGDRHAFP